MKKILLILSLGAFLISGAFAQQSLSQKLAMRIDSICSYVRDNSTDIMKARYRYNPAYYELLSSSIPTTINNIVQNGKIHIPTLVQYCLFYRYDQNYEQLKRQGIFLPHFEGHHKQIHSLSCESNTTRDVINYYRLPLGLPTVSEGEIVGKIPYESQRLVRSQGTLVRGDPDEGFVGNIKGSQIFYPGSSAGYGIYAKPLLPIINKYLQPAGVVGYESTELNEDTIINSLMNGHPVVFRYIRGETIQGTRIRTTAQRRHTFYKNQHIGVITGVEIHEDGSIKRVYYYDGLVSGINKKSYEYIKKMSDPFKRNIYFKEL